jgi:hypothetical protein
MFILQKVFYLKGERKKPPCGQADGQTCEGFVYLKNQPEVKHTCSRKVAFAVRRPTEPLHGRFRLGIF